MSLRLSQDKGLFASFQRHSLHFFPVLSGLHRTTLAFFAASMPEYWCRTPTTD
ncbi:hypothetical protein [Reticulibacter mediterranei]|uniref:hypothetical protein n=1 Tax=Reticulibacter mediterranei TaxID=2778369 RepID=UPI001F3F78D1|nr:hypothetical protein [Reticulibacter mediterranei]